MGFEDTPLCAYSVVSEMKASLKTNRDKRKKSNPDAEDDDAEGTTPNASTEEATDKPELLFLPIIISVVNTSSRTLAFTLM